MSAPNGCIGACCAAFHYSASHDDWADGKLAVMDIRDAERMQHMLVPITHAEAVERHEQFGSEESFAAMVGGNEKSVNLYKCIWWDEETRLCTNYEDRPTMCRDYPYERECPACDYRPEQTVVEHYVEVRTQYAISQELEAS